MYELKPRYANAYSSEFCLFEWLDGQIGVAEQGQIGYAEHICLSGLDS